MVPQPSLCTYKILMPGLKIIFKTPKPKNKNNDKNPMKSNSAESHCVGDYKRSSNGSKYTGGDDMCRLLTNTVLFCMWASVDMSIHGGHRANPQRCRGRASLQRSYSCSFPTALPLSNLPPTLTAPFFQLHQCLHQHHTAPACTKTIPCPCPPLSSLYPELPLLDFTDPAAYY